MLKSHRAALLPVYAGDAGLSFCSALHLVLPGAVAVVALDPKYDDKLALAADGRGGIMA